jgi:hypothetical protein
MLAQIMALFKPEIGSLIRPSESVEGGAESAKPARATAANRENDNGVSFRIRPNQQRGPRQLQRLVML